MERPNRLRRLGQALLGKLPEALPLVPDHKVALLFQEIGIRSGYRQPGGTWTQYLGSCCYPLHNESINIWTHFIPFLYNVWMLLWCVSEPGFGSNEYHWPFVVYLVSCCLWPLVSTLAHVFGAMSLRARHLGFLADYAALSQYSFGVAVAYHAYSLPRHILPPLVTTYYPLVTACAAVLCICMSAYSRIMPKTLYWRRKIVRSMAFFVPYVIVSLPILLRLVHSTVLSQADYYHLMQFICITTAFTFYNLHCPERMWPGAFDYIGHSHQVFHVLGATATYYQMHAIHTDLLAAPVQTGTHLGGVLLYVLLQCLNALVVQYVFLLVAPPASSDPCDSRVTAEDTPVVSPATQSQTQHQDNQHRWMLPQTITKMIYDNHSFLNIKLWLVRNKTD